jgi:hypothetical protein
MGMDYRVSGIHLIAGSIAQGQWCKRLNENLLSTFLFIIMKSERSMFYYVLIIGFLFAGHSLAIE